MTPKIKYFGLVLGLLSTIISFLFFARQQETYSMFLIGGILVSSIFFLIILFTNGTTKTKILWLIVVLLAIGIQRLTEPFLIKCSYFIFLNNNINELISVNNILIDKEGEIFILNDKVNDKNGILTHTEKENLLRLREKLNVYMITKSDDRIYYGLWGFLDVRLGLSYWTRNEKPNISYKHLKGNWYY